MIGNHEAVRHLGPGTSSIAGRAAWWSTASLTALRNGISIGNTPAPTPSAAADQRQRPIWLLAAQPRSGLYEGPAVDLVLESNSIRVDPGVDPSAFTRNGSGNNGRRAAPARSGSGPRVFYCELFLPDDTARGRPDGHRGKRVTVGAGRRVMLLTP